MGTRDIIISISGLATSLSVLFAFVIKPYIDDNRTDKCIEIALERNNAKPEKERVKVDSIFDVCKDREGSIYLLDKFNREKQKSPAE